MEGITMLVSRTHDWPLILTLADAKRLVVGLESKRAIGAPLRNRVL